MNHKAPVTLNLRILRLLLFVVAITGLPCSGSLFSSWETVAAVVKGAGIDGVPQSLSPIVEYWLRMMAGLRVLVGIFYLVAAWNPVKYKGILPILGWGMVFMTVIAAYHGIRLSLPSWSLYSDIGVFGICGLGILWTSRRI
jgi:hypothetical protein